MKMPLGQCVAVPEEIVAATNRSQEYYKITSKGGTPAPTAAPVAAPTAAPVAAPTAAPIAAPTAAPIAAPPSPSAPPPSPSPPSPSPPPPSPSLPPPSPPPDFSLVYTVALTDPATSDTAAADLQQATFDAVQATLTTGNSTQVVVEISETARLTVTLNAGRTGPEAIEATRLQLKVELCRGATRCDVITYDIPVSRRLADAGGTPGRRVQQEGDVIYQVDRSYTNTTAVTPAANATAVGAEVQGTETTALSAQAPVTPTADSTASAEELEATDDVSEAVGASLGTDVDVSAVTAYPPALPPSPSPSPPSPPSPPPADASDDDDKSGGGDGGDDGGDDGDGGGGGGGGGNVGAIAGGVVGGLAALLLIGGGYVWYTRKRAAGTRASEPKKKSSIVKMSVDRSSKPQSPEKEPAPYV